MDLLLKRIYTCPTYTIGHLYVNGEYVCDTIEDTDRGLTDSMMVKEIKSIKVYSKTAIPRGKYEVTMKVQSPKFSMKTYYKNFCNGYLPRLLNVKGFDGILIHIGNTANVSAGCILVGYNKVKGKVLDSQKAFEKLMKEYLMPAGARGEKITIQITKTYKQ